MNLTGWINLTIERDEHLANAQSAFNAFCMQPDADITGIVKRHLARIAQREVNIAQIYSVIIDSNNSPSQWAE